MFGGKEYNIMSLQVHGDALELQEPDELSKITYSDLYWTQNISVQHVSVPVFIEGLQVFCFVLAILELKGNRFEFLCSNVLKICYIIFIYTLQKILYFIIL